MDYTEIRKLDEETSKNLQESKGPVDKCICKIFTLQSGSEPSGKGVRASIKKVFGAISKSKTKILAITRGGVGGRGGGGGGTKSVTIPLGALAPGFIHTARRTLNWKKGDCGKCGCDNKPIFLKDSDFTIKITTPDIDLDAICPCKQNCMPDKAKLKDNIKVTIEHANAPHIELPQIEFLGKSIKSCIELGNPVKPVDHDSLQSGSKTGIVSRLPAIELIKSFTKEPFYAIANKETEETETETKRDTLALQKLPTVSIKSGSMYSNLDEASDVVILVDDDHYEKLFKTNIILSKETVANVFRSRSYTG